MTKARPRALRRLGLLVLLAASTGGCGEAPPSYRVVSLGEARALMERPEVALLDAVGAQAARPQPLPRGIRWNLVGGVLTPPAELPEGAVLIVASDERTAHRSAAALARGSHRPVYVYVPRSAEDRTDLQAHARTPEEPNGGRDS